MGHPALGRRLVVNTNNSRSACMVARRACVRVAWLASSTKVKPCIFVVDEVTTYRLAYYYYMFTMIFKRLTSDYDST